jgi:hypothetical protein
MRILKRYPDLASVSIAKSILEGEGMAPFIADENLASSDLPAIFATGGIRLMIPEEDYERACAILRDSETNAALPDDFDPNVPTSKAESPLS